MAAPGRNLTRRDRPVGATTSRRLRNAELVASHARIVALAVKVGLVKTLMASDPGETATGMLDELRGDVQATLTELRKLAHGIDPPLLHDRGLQEALKTAANRATLATSVDAADLGRFDTDVEAAVYFCCLEAMQNAGKHAGEDASLRVSVGTDDQVLWFEVRDDGKGFDMGPVADGHGFVNMRDRLGALDGDLTVTSAAGQGTIVRGTLPLGAHLADAATAT